MQMVRDVLQKKRLRQPNHKIARSMLLWDAMCGGDKGLAWNSTTARIVNLVIVVDVRHLHGTKKQKSKYTFATLQLRCPYSHFVLSESACLVTSNASSATESFHNLKVFHQDIDFLFRWWISSSHCDNIIIHQSGRILSCGQPRGSEL